MTALILGIVSWFVCPLCGIPAFIIGRKAQKEIDANPAAYDGRGLAMAGWIIGGIAMIFAILGLLFFIFAIVLAAGTATTTS